MDDRARALRLPAARLWIRGALRRPGRGVVVMLGMVAMSVATVASLVAGDALADLFERDAQAQWGDVDVLTFRPGEPLIGESLANFAGQDGAIEGTAWAARLVLDTVASTSPQRSEPDTTLLGVGADEQSFEHPLTGEGQVDPVQLGPDGVILNRRLADRIGAAIGEPVQLTIAVPEHTDQEDLVTIHDPLITEWTPTVEGIADNHGLADFGRTANVVARLDSVQRAAELEGYVSGLYLAAPGPGRDAAEDVTVGFGATNRRLGLVTVEAKEDALDVAREEGGLFRGILMTLALLVMAAAAVVTANLVILVGQERAHEIALLRSLGVRRNGVRRLFAVEAAAYVVAAAVIGALLAIPFAGALASAIADNFTRVEASRGRELVALDVTANPLTVGAGIVAVVLVAAATIRFAAARVATLDVSGGLRGAPPLLATRHREGAATRRTLLAGVLVLGMALTASGGRDVLLFLAACLLLTAWWVRRRGRFDDTAALLGLAFSVAAPAAIGDFSKGVQSSFGLLTLAGIAAVTCATILLSARTEAVMRAVRAYLPRSHLQASARTAAAYARQDRSRSATLIGTIAVVLFMVAALAVLGSATDIDTERQGGGYDVIGTTAVALDDRGLGTPRGASRVDTMEHILMGEGWFSTRPDDDDEGKATVPYPVRAILADLDFAEAQGFALADALPAYESSQQALDAAIRGGGVVVDRYARPEGAQPGDDVVIDDGRGPTTHRLLAVLDTYVLQGVLLGHDAYTDLFAERGDTFVLAAAHEGADAQALAALLDEVAADRGMAARTVAEAADRVLAVNRAFTDVFEVLLLVGLAVALVAVAALVARASRERAAELAVLRAMGWRRGDLRRLLLAEPLLLAALGVVTGLAVGLTVLWLLFLRGFSDLAFVVPWRLLGISSLGVLALVGLCALPAALAAARRPL